MAIINPIPTCNLTSSPDELTIDKNVLGKKNKQKTIQKDVWISWICYLGGGGPTPLIRGYLHLEAQPDPTLVGLTVLQETESTNCWIAFGFLCMCLLFFSLFVCFVLLCFCFFGFFWIVVFLVCFFFVFCLFFV